MNTNLQNLIKDARVSAVKLASAVYPETDGENEIAAAIRRSAENLGWSEDGRGAFGKIIKEGAKVVVKPNLVLHKNQGKDGLLPLITHQSIIKAVVAEVLKADPSQILVGDAPIQSCDFNELLRQLKLDEWSADLHRKDIRFKGIDEDRRGEENYVRYNLKADSLLEPLTDDKNSFRVTNYDPRLMAKTHSPGNHQYLVAREIIEADVVINLPKLKTHKKAGITNALKNLVGINGNKEFLPHHRLGGAADGGDCYPDKDLVKRGLEYIFDCQNMTKSAAKGKMLATVGTQFERAMRLRGDETGIEGAWSGNETVPRMCVDLNRVLLYGKSDATFGETVQRRVLHIVDAVIAGQGDGPLASDELPLGLILAGVNATAIDWVGAFLLGYDAGKIPLLRYAFGDYRWRIADFETNDIELIGDWQNDQTAANLIELARRQKVTYPAGWRDAKAEIAGD
jgi:uncharacterized protein (DUF362 family)